MKKKLCYVILVFLAGILLVLAVPFIFKSMQKGNIEFIQYSEMKDMLEEEREFFLIISREGCSDCLKLREELVESKDKDHSFYVFEYEKDLSETLGPELQEIFPEFVFVPYICYINNGMMEPYTGKAELKEIFEWMDGV